MGSAQTHRLDIAVENESGRELFEFRCRDALQMFREPGEGEFSVDEHEQSQRVFGQRGGGALQLLRAFGGEKVGALEIWRRRLAHVGRSLRSGAGRKIQSTSGSG